MKAWLAAGAMAVLAAPAMAAPTLAMPDQARQVRAQITPVGGVAIPVGPWTDAGMPVREAEGEVSMTAWQVPGQTPTLSLLAPLRDQLRAEGFEILYECATDACGGFDFRHDLTVLPEPEMHVDLGDFRYLAARKGEDYLCLLVSRSAETGFVQLTRVGASQPLPLAIVPSPASPAAAAPATAGADLPAILEATGAVALDDLVFASGSSELGTGEFPSLSALAAYLRSHADRRVTLVGHTDASGALAANIVLSRRRAQSVLTRLVAEYGVNPAQLAAEGVGFLSPRDSNLTEAGREKNRRVEAMLASTR